MFYVDRHALQADYADVLLRGVPGLDVRQLIFSVMHGNGNVILVVDETLSGLSSDEIGSDLARELCEAFTAVSVDGIAFVRAAEEPIRMTYFDRDGTNATMCGNALRCVTQYADERGYLRGDTDVIMTDDGPKWVSAGEGAVRVALGAGREFQRVTAHQYFAFSGVAHLVVLLDDSQDLDAIDVKTVGAALRYDEELCLRLNHPEGLHVDFMQRYEDGVRIRTYEVGVEDETRACGTGSAASAYVASRVWGLPYPIRVVVQEGEIQVEETDHGLVISGSTGHLFGNIPPLDAPIPGRASEPALAVGGTGG
ncbi:diaminopimelate epimerase [Actinocrinis sp.]|uniref:diaminopimelate epimerase n=1 Tax=Actinocrinis sp. TaxID=1920516 RepID=UPI002C30A05F|nr:diaminopimelate epimerase [Actinocrinis sp.]HXR69322.1 diaminopimelate epimerase [Actinocrinis sp.]